MPNPFQSVIRWISNSFSNNTRRMLIVTGAVGWALSSAAQIGAILFNPKISNEQKSFLVPQEAADALVNIIAFVAITQSVSKLTEKMFQTGKIATKSVRKFLNENENVLGKKVGHLDFNLDEVLMDKPELLAKYNTTKNYGTTLATVGASVLATNIITPLSRNVMASGVQKNYIAQKQIENPEIQKPELQQPQQTFKGYSGDLRI